MNRRNLDRRNKQKILVNCGSISIKFSSIMKSNSSCHAAEMSTAMLLRSRGGAGDFFKNIGAAVAALFFRSSQKSLNLYRILGSANVKLWDSMNPNENRVRKKCFLFCLISTDTYYIISENISYSHAISVYITSLPFL